MKKYREAYTGLVIGILICLCSTSIPIGGSSFQQNELRENTIIVTDTSMTVTYTFDPPSVETIQLEGSEYARVTIPGMTNAAEKPGDPLLPTKQIQTLVPQGKRIMKYDVVTYQKQCIESDVFLEPAIQPSINDENHLSSIPIPNLETYTSTKPYPLTTFRSFGVSLFRGYQFDTERICPFQYIPALQQLYFFPKITVILYLEDNPSVEKTSFMYRLSSVDAQEALSKMDIPNSQVVTSYQESSFQEFPEDQADLLIITTNSFAHGFNPLIAAHKKDGIRTEVRILGRDIPQFPDSNQTCRAIRDYITRIYKQLGIEYVLIGGDYNVIPARQLYYGPMSIPGYTADGCPSDQYYACLDGSYNSDNDDIVGESTDGQDIEGGNGDVDLIADVYVGRACVGTPQEVGFFANKTIRYMKSYPSTETSICNNRGYLRNVLMVGMFLFNMTPPMFGDDTMEMLIDESSALGIETVGFSSAYYHISKLYDREWPDYDWPAVELINRMNNDSLSIINNHVHGWFNIDMKLSNEQVDSLINPKPFFVYSEACMSGGFDADWCDCIAEHFTVKTDHGAFAGVWNARFGFNGISVFFHREFWDAVFRENISAIGAAHFDSKEDNIAFIASDTSDWVRWECYEANLFGDPAVQILDRPLHANIQGPSLAPRLEPVQFFGTLSGDTTPPYHWFWDFGDGTYSMEQNPIHQFYSVGDILVQLTVRDSRQKKDTCNTTITINSNNVWVDDDYYEGGWNDGHEWGIDAFKTVQDGIIAVSPDGTVSVAEGLYREGLSITKPLTISGVDRTSTRIDACGSEYGIRISSDDVTIRGCTIYNVSTYGKGIYFDAISRITITQNIIRDGTKGIDLNYQACNNTITQNIFIDNAAGIGVFQSSYNTITDNLFINITRTRFAGIYIDRSISNIFSENVVVNASNYGIGVFGNVEESRDNIIEDNVFNHCKDGVYLNKAKTTTIRGNRIMNSTEHGIYVYNYARENTLLNNTIQGSTLYGIYLYSYSTQNIVTENTVIDTKGYGICLRSVFGNTIYHNTFMNPSNVYIQQSGTNTWDDGYPSGGNYWSDYSGVDEFSGPYQDEPNPDGIGDTPYTINTNNVDQYPFMNQGGWNEL